MRARSAESMEQIAHSKLGYRLCFHKITDVTEVLRAFADASLPARRGRFLSRSLHISWIATCGEGALQC
jgi:hypothetical protein